MEEDGEFGMVYWLEMFVFVLKTKPVSFWFFVFWKMGGGVRARDQCQCCFCYCCCHRHGGGGGGVLWSAWRIRVRV